MIRKLLFNTLMTGVLLIVATLQTTESLSISEDKTYIKVMQTSQEKNTQLNEPLAIVETLYASNLDVKDQMLGILYIPGIALDVVMKSSDNQYYLHHDRYDTKNKKGELFASKRSLNQVSDLSLIYGHNNADGTKFGRLQLSMYSSDSSRIMYFYDGIVLKEYHLAFAFDFMDGSQVLERKDLTQAQRSLFLEDLKAQSRYEKQRYRDDAFAEILFLQTCLRAFGDERVVFAYELVSEKTS